MRPSRPSPRPRGASRVRGSQGQPYPGESPTVIALSPVSHAATPTAPSRGSGGVSCVRVSRAPFLQPHTAARQSGVGRAVGRSGGRSRASFERAQRGCAGGQRVLVSEPCLAPTQALHRRARCHPSQSSNMSLTATTLLFGPVEIFVIPHWPRREGWKRHSGRLCPKAVRPEATPPAETDHRINREGRAGWPRRPGSLGERVG